MELKLDNRELQTVCAPFDFTTPPYDPVELSNSMTLYREELKGMGLAANQVGIPLRVFSIKGFDSAVFNPNIVHFYPETSLMEEGCLSFPGLLVKIKRAQSIRLRWTNALGQTQTNTYTGLTARCIQHEMDHLNGILFYNRANKYHRDLAFNRLKNKHHKLSSNPIIRTMIG